MWRTDDSVSLDKIEAATINIDTDSDGIYDQWEASGIDFNLNGSTDLSLSTPNKNRKDVYVEIDYMQNHPVSSTALNIVRDAMAVGDISNPDNTDGITLHYQIGDQVPEDSSLNIWPEFDTLKDTWFGTSTERGSSNKVNILGAKALVYHYTIWADNLGGVAAGRVGYAEQPGNDFVVGLGATPSNDDQASTFMHELGHNLGLGHGGGDGIQCKPNYISIMNYLFVTPSIITGRQIQYSDYSGNKLIESNLSEPAGIKALSRKQTAIGERAEFGFHEVDYELAWTNEPVHYNNDADTIDTAVSENINNFGVLVSDCHQHDTPGTETLYGYDDYLKMKLYQTSFIDFGDGPAYHPPSIKEMSYEDYVNIKLMSLNQSDRILSEIQDTAFRVPSNASALKEKLHGIMTNDAEESIEKLFRTGKYDKAVEKMKYVKTLVDGSLGGNPADDIITDSDLQWKLFRLAERSIAIFEIQQNLDDQSGPIVQITGPVEGATYRVNEVVKAKWKIDDIRSFAYVVNATAGSGELIDTKTPGKKSCTVTAIDGTGNVTLREIFYHVKK